MSTRRSCWARSFRGSSRDSWTIVAIHSDGSGDRQAIEGIRHAHCGRFPPPVKTSRRRSMGFPVRKCAVIGRFVDPRVAESLSSLLPHLKGRGIQVLISESADIPDGLNGVTRLPEEDVASQADLLIA